MKDHIIICGLGQIGFRTYELLLQMIQKITVISPTTNEDWRHRVEQSGNVFIVGDARNEGLLIEAGIKDAKAILALTDEDIVNVSIAMDARKLNPKIRIISRMFDTKLGIHISTAFDVSQVFSTSELAAPIYISCIQQRGALAQFHLHGETYAIYEEVEAKPHPDAFTLLELNEQDQTKKLMVKKIKTRQKSFLNSLIKLYKKLNFLRSPTFANFRRFLFVILMLILTSALLLSFEMPLPFIKALYFVTATVTTVGYGDINFLHSSDLLKVFGCFLMLSGATAVAVMFSSITEIILSKKLTNLLGGQPVPLKNHVLMIGAGHIGHRIAEILTEDDTPIVVIESESKERYGEDVKHSMAVVAGNPRNENTLLRARCDTAKAILVITDDDVENLSVTLAAKKINPNIIAVAQIFNAKLGDRLQSALGVSRILSVSSISSPYFAAATIADNILLALKWNNHLVFLSQTSTKPFSASNKKLSQHFEENVVVHAIELT